MTRYATLPNEGHPRDYLLVSPISIGGPTRAVSASTLLEIQRRTGFSMVDVIDIINSGLSFVATKDKITVRQRNGVIHHYTAA